MTYQMPPKPNTQALSWFYGENKSKTLRLTPKYQRNPIWSIGQNCFLIDSIISGCPLPQVFLNVVTVGGGASRKTIYEVVDGQQRLRAILDYMNDIYSLVETTAKSYPISDLYKPHIGRKYSQLPSSLQDVIWNYPLAVQELRGWDELQIRALFRRLNYVVERLSKQELRHSQYFGEFVNAVELLSEDTFWDDVGLFTRRDSQRMKDIEFISELFSAVISGPQDQQKTLDKFYADYDVVFPKKKKALNDFKVVVETLKTYSAFIKNSRFTKKADFYAIFCATREVLENGEEFRSTSQIIKGLQSLETELNLPVEEMSDMASRYYATIIEGPNKLAKRVARIKALKNLLIK